MTDSDDNVLVPHEHFLTSQDRRRRIVADLARRAHPTIEAEVVPAPEEPPPEQPADSKNGFTFLLA